MKRFKPDIVMLVVGLNVLVSIFVGIGYSEFQKSQVTPTLSSIVGEEPDSCS